MTAEELNVMLNLRATLSEYEHFMCELSAMIERGVDVPPTGVAKFPMREKLYAQVRDLVMGEKCMSSPIKPFVGEIPDFTPIDPSFAIGDHVYWAANHDAKGVITTFSADGTKALLKLDKSGQTDIHPLKELIHCDDGK